MKGLIGLVALLFISSVALAEEEGPGCPELPAMTEIQSEVLFQAIAEGKTVVQCQNGGCWDFVTDEVFTEFGGIPLDGFYVGYFESGKDHHVFKFVSEKGIDK